MSGGGPRALPERPVVRAFLRFFDWLNGTAPVQHATREEVLDVRARQLRLERRVRGVEERLRVLESEAPDGGVQ